MAPNCHPNGFSEEDFEEIIKAANNEENIDNGDDLADDEGNDGVDNANDIDLMSELRQDAVFQLALNLAGGDETRALSLVNCALFVEIDGQGRHMLYNIENVGEDRVVMHEIMQLNEHQVNAMMNVASFQSVGGERVFDGAIVSIVVEQDENGTDSMPMTVLCAAKNLVQTEKSDDDALEDIAALFE